MPPCLSCARLHCADLAPHGYPDDLVDLNAAPAPGERCDAKFNVTRRMVQDLVRAFPHSRWAFALGNNDHFPKDSYWQAYTHRLADMMLEEGFLTSGQHDQVQCARARCTAELY